MQIENTKTFFKYPFYMDGTIRDYASGYPVFNAHYYQGKCTVHGALFETWIDEEQASHPIRAWRCINPNYVMGNRI